MRFRRIPLLVTIAALLAIQGCRPPAQSTQQETTVAPAPSPAAVSPTYLLWRAPGGIAGTGPAVEVQANGIMHAWASTSGLRPHETQGWDIELLLPPDEVDELFDLLAAVDFRALPHPTTGALECYPVLYIEYEDRPPITLRYTRPEQLRPEMDQVLAWFDDTLRNQPARAPSRYCVF